MNAMLWIPAADTEGREPGCAPSLYDNHNEEEEEWNWAGEELEVESVQDFFGPNWNSVGIKQIGKGNAFSLCNSIHYLMPSMDATYSHLPLFGKHLVHQCCQAERPWSVLRGEAIHSHHSEKKSSPLPTITTRKFHFLTKCKHSLEIMTFIL